MNRAKIIATVGPACANKKTLQKLISHGVSCFRINLSHGSALDKASYFDLIRSLEMPSGFRPTILADLLYGRFHCDPNSLIPKRILLCTGFSPSLTSGSALDTMTDIE